PTLRRHLKMPNFTQTLCFIRKKPLTHFYTFIFFQPTIPTQKTKE
ncbi:MAG: hypothetical protein ACI9DK_002291, partial [Vicingaceae bacterium]